MPAADPERTARAGAGSPALHALAVVAGYTLLFTWFFAFGPFLRHGLLSDADLYEYFLPQFLSPITLWSSFEFGGMPAFGDPNDAVWYPLQAAMRLAGSWNAYIVAVFVVAASGAYAYVYSLTRSRTAAVFSGLAYALAEALVERIAHTGLLNTIAWFPLVLLSIDRLRGARAARWIGTGALIVATCFLAGNPQTFLYAGYVLALYALVGGIAERAPYRYYLSALVMAALGALLTAVKAAPMLEASLYTARQVVRFEAFAGHANTPAQMLSMLLPTIAHEGREAPTYVGLATLVFALASIARIRRNWRVGFWLAVVVVALLLGAGDATPVSRLVFGLPLYEKFRIGARHLVFAALGCSALAGIGLAAVQRREVSLRGAIVSSGVVLLALVGGAALVAHWPGAFEFDDRVGLPWALPWWNDGAWTQILLGAAVATAVVGFASGRGSRLWTGLLILLLTADLAYALPYRVTWTGLDLPMMPVEATTPSVHARTLAARAAPLHQRLLSPSGTHLDALVPAMFARLWKIPIAGGYGPMLLSRYGALGMMGTNGSVDPLVLADHDAALDLLAVRFVTMHAEDFAPGDTIERQGVTWSAAPLGLLVGPEECGQRFVRRARYALPAGVNTTAVALEAHLRCAEGTPQGTAVMLVKVIDEAGAVYEQTLRAGVEIADEGLKDPAVLRRAGHTPAVIADPSAERYSYITRIDLPAPMRGARIDVLLSGTAGSLAIDRMTAIDVDGRQVPQTQAAALLDRERWRPAGEAATSRESDRGRDDDTPGEGRYLFFENRRARPLAWLAGEVIPLDDREMATAIHSALLPDGRKFDPAAMVLVESGSAPAVRYQTGASAASVVSARDGAFRVNASSAGGAFLVLSEAWYPGWRARVDGVPAPLIRTYGALQGVAVPAGVHRVEFELVSDTLRAGAGGTLAGLAIAALFLWRGRA